MERNSNPEYNITAQHNSSPSKRRAKSASSSQIRDWFYLCLAHWKWFVLSVLLCVAAAAWYLLRTPKQFTCMASIMVKTDQDVSNSEKDLMEMGVMKTSTNMANELHSFKTTEMGRAIVERLGLQTDYSLEGTFHSVTAYGSQLPLELHFDDLGADGSASASVSMGADSIVTLSHMVCGGSQIPGSIRFKVGRKVNSPFGVISASLTPYYIKGENVSLSVSYRPLASVASSVAARIQASQRDKASSVIDIRYRDTSVERANNVLSALIDIYSENWIKQLANITNITSEFIEDRLNVLENELGNVDENISLYKSQNLTPNVQQAASMAMTQAAEAEGKMQDIANRLQMANYVRDYLQNPANDNKPLPASTGIQNQAIEAQITSYNELMLKRNQYMSSSSANNPMIADLNVSLASMRQAIVQTLANEIAMLQAESRAASYGRYKANALIAKNPKQEQHLLTDERRQKVKETLFLYLLQKREENELSQAFTINDTKLIEMPHNTGAPGQPQDLQVILLAIAVGILIPGAVVITRDKADSSVRGRKDLEGIDIPFVGEIPQASDSDAQGDSEESRKDRYKLMVVAEKGHDPINEAFRVLRSNLGFIMGFDSASNVIMITSMNPQSGKTFISRNLAASISFVGKRVVAVDMDMRKASLSRSVDDPDAGLSDYLSGRQSDYRKLITKLGDVDVIPCGVQPPNPTELLYSPKLEKLLTTLSQDYDYVLLDCPPVEIVADVNIINRFVDATLFVVRAGLFDKQLLPDIEQWYSEKRYKNLSLLLNGTSHLYGGYGNLRYGYHYGYYYSYGDEKKTKKRKKSKTKSKNN